MVDPSVQFTQALDQLLGIAPPSTGAPNLAAEGADLLRVAALLQEIDFTAEVPSHPELGPVWDSRFNAQPAPGFRARYFAVLLRRPALAITLAVLLIILLGLAVIGPQRVAAGVEQLLGYLPGVGFVNPSETRTLVAPVEAHQGNSTLVVEQVVAGPGKTLVVFTLHSTPEEINVGMDWMDKVKLVFPTGAKWGFATGEEQITSLGDLSATLQFSQLPAGVDRVSLEMPTLPLAADPASQEYWSVDLPLQAVGQAPTPGAAEGTGVPSNLAFAPYTPANSQASNQGVTVRVLQVAASPQETGLLLQVGWRDPTWDFQGLAAELRDDQGRVVRELRPPPGSDSNFTGQLHGVTMATVLLRFAALAPDARQATLAVNQVHFEIYPQAQFSFDPGEHTQIGDTWNFPSFPGKRMNVAGFWVQILRAELTPSSPDDQPIITNPPSATALPPPTQLPPLACHLAFTLDIAQQPHARLDIGSTEIDGMSVGSGVRQIGDGPETLTLYLSEIPTRPVTVQVKDAYLHLQGGWQIRWDLPGGTPSSNTP